MSASIVSYLPTVVPVGQTQQFQVCTTATPPEQGELVNVYIVLSNPMQRTQLTLEYYDTTSGTFQPITFNASGVAIFGPGPPAGFPLENTCSTFRITFLSAGSYSFSLEIRRASDSIVLGSTTETVTTLLGTSSTSGVIVNNGTNPSTSLDIVISNDSMTDTATIDVELFEVVVNPEGGPKTGTAHQVFTIAPLTVVTRTLGIAGFTAYEVQFLVSGADIVIDLFAIDLAGNLSAVRRVLNSEMSIIASISPLP